MQNHEQAQTKLEAGINWAIGIGGITIGLQDITHIAQAIAAVGGAFIVLVQLYRMVRRRK